MNELTIEKIEKELSVSLITLFTATKQGMWIKRYDELIFLKPDDFVFGFDFKIIGYGFITIDEEVVSSFVRTKEYGKTWALTKEELE